MSSYHVEILDSAGAVLTQADVTVKKVSDIECVRSADFVGILVGGETVATGYLTTDQAEEDVFTARRTPGGGGDPVEIKIRA